MLGVVMRSRNDVVLIMVAVVASSLEVVVSKTAVVLAPAVVVVPPWSMVDGTNVLVDTNDVVVIVGTPSHWQNWAGQKGGALLQLAVHHSSVA